MTPHGTVPFSILRPGIRTAAASDGCTAHQSVEHDDLNVLYLGARVIAPELPRERARPRERVRATRLSGAERHLRRLAEAAELEDDNVAHTRAPAKESEA